MNLTALAIAASSCLLAIIVLPPGLPTLTFTVLAVICILLLWREGVPGR